MELKNTDLITVCSKCKRACCWLGELMCDDAQTASTIEKTVKQLKRLDLEHSDYWKQQKEI